MKAWSKAKSTIPFHDILQWHTKFIPFLIFDLMCICVVDRMHKCTNMFSWFPISMPFVAYLFVQETTSLVKLSLNSLTLPACLSIKKQINKLQADSKFSLSDIVFIHCTTIVVLALPNITMLMMTIHTLLFHIVVACSWKWLAWQNCD